LAGVTGAATAAHYSTLLVYSTRPLLYVSLEVKHCQFGSLTVWLPPHVLDKVGRQHFFGGANVQPSFLPCDAMRCTVFEIVTLSVWLSVTLVHCVHMVRHTIVIF